MSVAPIAINFMLTCYFSPEPAEALGASHWDSPAGIETRQWLLDNGLIDIKSRSTDRGEAWVKFICATPLPIQDWRLPTPQPGSEKAA